MKKRLFRTLSVFLVFVLLLSAAPLAGLFDFEFSSLKAKAASKTWAVGDIGYMGMYPQSKVTDADLISELNSQTLSWVSYGYYSGTGSYGTMVSGDWMKYADVSYGGSKYRAVTFTQYRPYRTEYSSSTDHTDQDDNGYTTGNTYWFKYEPIAWKVLDPSAGLVMSEMTLDSQAYNNTIYHSGNDYYNNSACTVYANDYVTSSIRKWLNDDFYNTAFSSDEKEAIQTTTLDNSDYDTSSYSKYNSASTNDKIFLLSYADAHNSAYGFDSITGSSSSRYAEGTDYAKSQGLWVSTGNSYLGNSNWRLRSPGSYSFYACAVNNDGGLIYSFGVNSTNYGVRVTFKTNLQSSIFKSEKPEIVCTEHVYSNFISNNDGTHTRTCTVCGEAETANCSYTSTVTAPTCTQQGYTTHTCSVCGYSYRDTYTETLGHDYQTVVTPPTCTERGYTTHTCSRCGDSYKDNYVPALGHSYTQVTKDPTCTEAGLTTYTCSVCGDTYTETIPALGHIDEDGDGVCDRCGQTIADVHDGEKCPLDGQYHGTSFFGKLILFFDKIVYFFRHLFGQA